MSGSAVLDGLCANAHKTHTVRNLWLCLFCGVIVGCGGPPEEPDPSDPPTPHVTPPEANAGYDRTVVLGQKVILNARVNVGDGYRYAWSQTAGPSASLTSNDQPRTSFVPTEAGNYDMTLTVGISDLEDSDSVTITAVIDDDRNPPIADAGADLTLPPDVHVELDGRASYDPDGGALSYQWRQIDGPEVELSGADTARPTFASPETASDLELEFELFVQDDQNFDDTDSVVITISASAETMQYNLGTLVQGGGVIVPSQGAYEEGSELSVTASAHAGWQFVRWEGDLAGGSNPLSVVFDANTFLIAVFEQVGFTLTVEVEGEGTVDPNGGTFESFSEVTLTPTPANANWKFDRWTGDLTESDNPATVTMEKDKTITAVFVEVTQASAPAFDPPSHTLFNGTIAVTISSITPEAEIYYTTDGSEPTKESTLYTEAILLRKSTTINARAYRDGLDPSAITSANYQTMMVPAKAVTGEEDR